MPPVYPAGLLEGSGYALGKKCPEHPGQEYCEGPEADCQGAIDHFYLKESVARYDPEEAQTH